MIQDRDFGSRRRPRGRTTGELALIAAAVALMGVVGYGAAAAWLDLRDARGSLDAVRREVTDAEARLRSLQAPAGAEGTMGARAIWSLEAPPPRVVGEIARALPPDVRLEALTLRYGAELDAEMTVSARSAAGYEAFLDALERVAAFDAIAPGAETRDGGVRASVRARFNAAATPAASAQGARRTP